MIYLISNISVFHDFIPKPLTFHHFKMADTQADKGCFVAIM